MSKSGHHATLHATIAERNYSMAAAQVPELRHFLFLAKSIGQMTTLRFEAPYMTRKEQKRCVPACARLSCGGQSGREWRS